MGVIAAAVDSEEKTLEVSERLGLGYPVAYGVTRDQADLLDLHGTPPPTRETRALPYASAVGEAPPAEGSHGSTHPPKAGMPTLPYASAAEGASPAEGSWWDDGRNFIQPSESVLAKSGKVLMSTYSNSPIGRMDSAEALTLVTMMNARRKG